MRWTWIVVLAVILPCTPSGAVGLRVPEQYPTIQAAIDAAAAGDVITIGPGNYKESLVIQRDLVLLGAGATATEVCLQGWGEGLVIAGGAVELDDLELSSSPGATIRVQTGSLTSARCLLDSVPLLVTSVASATMVQCTFRGVRGGSSLQDSAHVEMTTCAFHEGGLSLYNSAHVVLTACTVQSASISLFDAASAALADCTVSASRVGRADPALSLWGNANALLKRCTLREGSFGAELRDNASAELIDCQLRDNSLIAVAAWDTSQATGSGNVMVRNGCDLAGNVAAGFRVPLREATERTITVPDPRYPTLQEAIDALRPGGRLRLQGDEFVGGVTIDKGIRISSATSMAALIRGKGMAIPVLSCVGGADVHLDLVDLTDGRWGLMASGDASATLFEHLHLALRKPSAGTLAGREGIRRSGPLRGQRGRSARRRAERRLHARLRAAREPRSQLGCAGQRGSHSV